MKISGMSAFIYLILTFGRALASAAELSVEYSVLGDTAHLEFSGKEHWEYDLKRKSAKGKQWIEIQVNKLSEKAIRTLLDAKGGPVEKTEVVRNGPDGDDLIRLYLSVKDVESFDYLTDQPSRLILDLYPQKQKFVENKTPKSLKKPEKELPKRSIATTDVLIVNPQGSQVASPSAPVAEASKPQQSGVFDGSDINFSRFSIQDYEIREEAKVQSREKDYIDFPVLHDSPDELQILLSRRPVYEIKETDSKDPKTIEENKMARLLLKLFMNKRYLVFLKTVEWFYEKFPESQYDELIRFMTADAHYILYEEDPKKISHFDLALFKYREILHKYPKSALAERTHLFIGFASLDRGDYLGAVRTFQQHLTERPQSNNRDLVKIAMAEALLKLNQFDDAIKVYDDVEKTAKKPEDRRRAAFLRGDVLVLKKEDLAAVKNYQEGLQKYPEGSSEFPNAYYNQAAALFRQKDFRGSLEKYKDFIRRFPSHPFAGYALTRVGETLEILGADASRVMGAYLETYFRYGDSPSSTVARMRILGARMKNMKPKELEKSKEEIQELAKKSNLPGLEQFSVLLMADGLSSRGQYDEAIDFLVKYYREHVTTADTDRLQKRIVRNINEKLSSQVQSGKFLDALRTHQKYADNWLKTSDRIDTKFWVGVAFEQAGVFSESEKLYRDTMNRIYALQGTTAGYERAVVEQIPSVDEMHLRMASVQFQQANWKGSFEQLKNIQKPETLSEKDQIWRVQMISSLLDKKGEPEVALRYLAELIKTWKGVPSLVSSPYFDAAEIELKLGKTDEALKSYQRVDELMGDSQEVSPTLHSKSLERIAQIYLDQKKPDQAVPVLEKLLEGYESKRPLSSWRYKLGMIHFEKGQIQKAAEVWKGLKSEKSDFWYKLAQEQLKGSEWNDEYKKYMKRIPAMAEKGGTP